MKPHIVFDFDGTLADSRSIFLQCYNSLANRYGFHPIDENNIEQLKKLSMLERFRQLKVPLIWLPILTRKFLRSYREHVHEIPFMEGIEELLKQLNEDGYDITILSSNSSKTIYAFLEAHSVNYVSGVYSSGKLFSKEKLLSRFIKKNRIEKTSLIYICDELRDVEACRKAGIPVVWVSWGFEEIEVFEHQPPELIVHTPSELLAIIHNLNCEDTTSERSDGMIRKE